MPGAVSPAVAVQKMVSRMEKHSGTEKGIPQLIPAGTSLDDVFVIPLSLGLACGKSVLSSAVLSVIATAPPGAFGMDISYKKLLCKEKGST